MCIQIEFTGPESGAMEYSLLFIISIIAQHTLNLASACLDFHSRLSKFKDVFRLNVGQVLIYRLIASEYRTSFTLYSAFTTYMLALSLSLSPAYLENLDAKVRKSNKMQIDLGILIFTA